MKGKKLFELINDLSKSERHQLLNACKATGDKRHKALYLLIRSKFKDEIFFQKRLEHIGMNELQKNNEHETDRNIRRFIDFSIKQIEEIKIFNYLSTNVKIRKYLLAGIYNKKKTFHSFLEYATDAMRMAEREDDLMVQSECLDWIVKTKLLTQAEKDLTLVKKLVVEQRQLIHAINHRKLSNSYNLLSNLYFDNKNILSELQEMYINEEDMNVLIRSAGSRPETIEYKIAQARFVFDNDKKLNQFLSDADKLMNGCDASEFEKQRLQRRICFLKMLGAFHHGKPVKELLNYSSTIMRINDECGFYDGLGAFYHLWFLMINADVQTVEVLIPSYRKKYFKDDNIYLLQFLEGYKKIKEDDLNGAVKILNPISTVDNYYIAIWAQFLEMKIHFNKENFDVCELLLNRVERLLQINISRIFTNYANEKIIDNYYSILKFKTPARIENTLSKTVSCFHIELMQWQKSMKV